MIQQLINKYFQKKNSGAKQAKQSQQFPAPLPEVDIYFSESEWDALPPEDLERTERTEAFLDGVVNDTSSSTHIFPLRKWLVAASVLLLVGTGTLYLLRNENKQPASLSNTATIANVEVKSAVNTITQRNDLSKAVSLHLPDGSSVLLSAHSQISYLPQLEINKRDIYLEGEAVFEVAHDAKRPFSVYCKEVQTTALGTKFKVSVLKDSSHVSVLLLEGKILVKSTATAYTTTKYYLLPGNEIDYNRSNNRFTMNSANNFNSNAIAKITIAKPENNNEEITADAHIQMNAEKKFIRFNDVGMAKVLNIIALKYGVSIAYPTERINDIRFVGTLNEQDAVQKILYNITSINNLELVVDTAHKKYTIK